jgi:bacillolysin
MQKIYVIGLLSLTIVCIQAAHGQGAFDRKQKTNVAADVSSLNARRITQKKATSSGRELSPTVLGSLNISLTRQPHKVLHSMGNLPVFIQSDRKITTSSLLAPSSDVSKLSYDYLDELSPMLGISDVRNTFSIHRLQRDRNGSHIRMQQHYKSIPVHGAEIVVHLNANGEGEALNGKYVVVGESIDIVPGIPENLAVEKVKKDIAKGSPLRPLSALERKLVQYADPLTTLCIYEDNSLIKSYLLAYHIVYSPSIHQRWEYFVDAHTGHVLRQFNSVCFVDGPKTATAQDLNGNTRTINTYQKGANYFMLDVSRGMFDGNVSTLPNDPVGGILTIDLSNTFGEGTAYSHLTTTTNAWTTANHAKAVSAHYNAGKAYEYFLNHHDRNSINGSGGTMISIINVSDPESGTAMDNAFWNGQTISYGNGSVAFKPLAGALDVAGHEMTHGVVQNTANLEYSGESGAINESMSDIFGVMMDPDDWTIGEEIVKLNAYPSGALRSMEDPHNGGTSLSDPGFQPRHMNEKFNGSEDNGGVHINSGIPNYAFFLLAEAITREKAASIFYRALDIYLTKSSQFIDLRLGAMKAAADLFGTSSSEVLQAGLAFDAVGITSGQGGDYVDDLPSNPGSEFLLVYSTDPQDANSLYRAPVDLSSSTALTTTIFKSKPSVTDDGSAAVFVAEDKTIHLIVTEPGEAPDEFVLQEETIWSNVAISKGGNRLAAVTEAWDNKIYVYDFSSEQWGEFELYNPTYSGVNASGTVYADALEWDYTGEFIVYDAFNRIENSDGGDIEYWDVNFLRAWNVEANNFGDGTIEKLFSSLPEGVSIGNPTFAKLSPNILAFDMIDEENELYAVLGTNVETGDTEIIFDTETLGYPSFNKNDSRLAFTLDDGTGGYYTGFVTLNSNKISSPNSTATGMFSDTMWPVYFSAGTRDIGDEVTSISPENKNVTLSCYPNPFDAELNIELTESFAPRDGVEIINLMGQRVRGYSTSRSDQTLRLDIDQLPPGHYVIHVQNGSKRGVCKVVKVR